MLIRWFWCSWIFTIMFYSRFEPRSSMRKRETPDARNNRRQCENEREKEKERNGKNSNEEKEIHKLWWQLKSKQQILNFQQNQHKINCACEQVLLNNKWITAKNSTALADQPTQNRRYYAQQLQAFFPPFNCCLKWISYVFR